VASRGVVSLCSGFRLGCSCPRGLGGDEDTEKKARQFGAAQLPIYSSRGMPLACRSLSFASALCVCPGLRWSRGWNGLPFAFFPFCHAPLLSQPLARSRADNVVHAVVEGGLGESETRAGLLETEKGGLENEKVAPCLPHHGRGRARTGQLDKPQHPRHMRYIQ
jgi:hypothetical protein